MGEGGFLILINGTPYTWRKSNEHSYQMNQWSFPESIEPGKTATISIEYKQTITTTRTDTAGEVQWSLDGSDSSFWFHVKDEPSNIWVEFSALETKTMSRGSRHDLGWAHDGFVTFILSGKEGNFHSARPDAGWMQSSLPLLGDLPFSQICMLGTHDSGMFKVTHSDIPGGMINGWVHTQSQSVHNQLLFGARYFDIRPEISGGQFYACHYWNLTKLGARGESMIDIIDGVNLFLNGKGMNSEDHPFLNGNSSSFGDHPFWSKLVSLFEAPHPELVILNFSHDLQSDTEEWRRFNHDEWHQLIGLLKNRLQNLFKLVDRSKADDLSLLTLNDFIGSGAGAVICIVHSDVDLDGYDGFYKPDQLKIRDQYSNTNDAVKMRNDQLQKMRDHMSVKDEKLSLLSWTLTPQILSWNGNPFDLIAPLESVRSLAYTANKDMLQWLLPEISKTSFPNVVYMDFLDSYDYLQLVLAINDKVYNN